MSAGNGNFRQIWHGLQPNGYRWYGGSRQSKVRNSPALFVKADQPRSSRRRKERPTLGRFMTNKMLTDEQVAWLKG